MQMIPNDRSDMVSGSLAISDRMLADTETPCSPLSWKRSKPCDPALARQRSEWVYKMLAGQYLKSISLHDEGPSDNTLRRYMRGIKSNRDGSIRGQLAAVFACDIEDVPF
jgi:hypothetical protein